MVRSKLIIGRIPRLRQLFRTMHNVILLSMLLTLVARIAADKTFSPFAAPNLFESPSIGNTTIIPPHGDGLELRRAVATCNPCSNLNAATVCCTSNGICTYDWAGQVACCWSGTSCTGTLNGGATVSISTTSTSTTFGLTAILSTVTASPTSATPTTQTVTATTANGIVIILGNGGSSGATSIQRDSVSRKLLAVSIFMICGIVGSFLGR